MLKLCVGSIFYSGGDYRARDTKYSEFYRMKRDVKSTILVGIQSCIKAALAGKNLEYE